MINMPSLSMCSYLHRRHDGNPPPHLCFSAEWRTVRHTVTWQELFWQNKNNPAMSSSGHLGLIFVLNWLIRGSYKIISHNWKTSVEMKMIWGHVSQWRDLPDIPDIIIPNIVLVPVFSGLNRANWWNKILWRHYNHIIKKLIIHLKSPEKWTMLFF